MHRNPEPLGTQFASWTVVAYAGTNRHNMRLVEVECRCGSRKTVILANLRAGVSRQCKACALRSMVAERSDVPWVPPTAKLNRPMVREIKRRLRFEKVSKAQLARDYQVHVATISRISDGRCWADVEWPETNDFPA